MRSVPSPDFPLSNQKKKVRLWRMRKSFDHNGGELATVTPPKLNAELSISCFSKFKCHQ